MPGHFNHVLTFSWSNPARAGPPAAATQKSATLELTPRQAETFAAARASGTLSLTLRSFADSQSPDQGGNTNDPPRSITVVRYGVTSGGSWW